MADISTVMNYERVFERTTKKGQKLECLIKYTDISSGVAYLPRVAFLIDGQERRKKSMWEFADIATLKKQAAELKGAASKGYAELAADMEKAGASDIWNLQIALYGNERAQIEAALKEAFNKRVKQAEELIAENPLSIDFSLGNTGKIAVAENANFSYHGLHEYEGCRPKTAEFDRKERAKFNLFIPFFGFRRA